MRALGYAPPLNVIPAKAGTQLRHTPPDIVTLGRDPRVLFPFALP
jgi:hypothetical protein